MLTLTRGQKVPLSSLTNAPVLRIALAASAAGLTLDFSCFGVDANNTLSDDRYFVFYNQKASPEGALRIVGERAGEAATFEVDLPRLPAQVRRLVFVFTIDGAGEMSQIASGRMSLLAGSTELARFDFVGRDFQNEKAVMAGEVYWRDGWRLAAVGQGFRDGLSAVLKHFGGIEHQPTASTAPPQTPPRAAPASRPPATVAPPPVTTPPVTVLPPVVLSPSSAPPSNAVPPNTASAPWPSAPVPSNYPPHTGIVPQPPMPMGAPPARPAPPVPRGANHPCVECGRELSLIERGLNALGGDRRCSACDQLFRQRQAWQSQQNANSQLAQRQASIQRILNGELLIVPPEQAGIVLKRGEVCHYVTPASLHEERVTSTVRVRHGVTGRVRICKGVTYRAGATHGKTIPIIGMVQIDSGTLCLTNQRCVFDGQRKSHSVLHTKLVSFEPFADGLILNAENKKAQQFKIPDGEIAAAILSTIVNS